jgi:surface protein
MFSFSEFNGDISRWDVSNVTNMMHMFSWCKNFNGNISNWDVSNVTNMQGMFSDSKFNGDIS